MAFWKKILGTEEPRPVDYYSEGLDLLSASKFHEALTSFRLALKESPGDAVVLQQIAICYTRIGMVEEAAKTYRHVLQKSPDSAGAHYGLAFILLRGETPQDAIAHLEAFLSHAPREEDAGAHVEHARWTLAQLREQQALEVADLQEQLGESRSVARDLERAREELETLRDGNADAAELSQLRGELEQARDEIEQVSHERELLREELQSAGEMIERLGKELERS